MVTVNQKIILLKTEATEYFFDKTFNSNYKLPKLYFKYALPL
jgi:hypothetical protein